MRSVAQQLAAPLARELGVSDLPIARRFAGTSGSADRADSGPVSTQCGAAV